MNEIIQAKLDAMDKLAENSTLEPTPPEVVRSLFENDSLAKLLTNPDDAEVFAAELEAVIRIAQRKAQQSK
jgi:hypothetical protein